MKRNSQNKRRGLASIPVLAGAAITLFLLCKGLGLLPSTVEVPSAKPVAAKTVVAKTVTAKTVAFKNIEDIRVGDRVITDVSQSLISLANKGREVADWERGPFTVEDFRVIDLFAPKTDGTHARVTLLRPLTWIRARNVQVGGNVEINVPECGIRGHGDVLRIGPAPAIKLTGEGQVVTGTFAHSSAQVISVWIEGERNPIGTTANHLFFSPKRGKFIRADRLRQGDLVATRFGQSKVTRLDNREVAAQVYNFEVAFHHVYRIGRGGVLVHNSGDCPPAPKSASESLPQLKGKSEHQVRKTLEDAGYTQTRVSNSPARNETWTHADGSEVRIHPYGNQNQSPYRSANNAHIHKQDALGNQLNDRGLPSTVPADTHIGIPNPQDLPIIRARPHGAGTQ